MSRAEGVFVLRSALTRLTRDKSSHRLPQPSDNPDGNPTILPDRGSNGPSAMFLSVAAAGSRLVSHLNMGARVDSIVELEERPYGPESTHEEREAIADRASVVDDRILLIHEIAVQSPFSVKVMFDRFQSLARDWDRFAYVVDLTDAKRPDPETRAALKAQILAISSRVTHLAVAVGDNQLMRAMARLFAYGMGLTNVSIHATRAEAIEEARRAMGR